MRSAIEVYGVLAAGPPPHLPQPSAHHSAPAMRSPPRPCPNATRVQDHKPHAIVVGASSPEARTLEQDIR